MTKTNFNIISKKINKIIGKIKYKETKTNLILFQNYIKKKI